MKKKEELKKPEPEKFYPTLKGSPNVRKNQATKYYEGGGRDDR